MINIEALEKKHNLEAKVASKKQTKELNDSVKPKSFRRHTKILSSVMKMINNNPPPVFQEYRSLALPVIGGVTWKLYKYTQKDVTEDEYNTLMCKIITSPDMNHLMREQLNFLDGIGGVPKLCLTALSKAVEQGSKKMLSASQRVSEVDDEEDLDQEVHEPSSS